MIVLPLLVPRWYNRSRLGWQGDVCVPRILVRLYLATHFARFLR
jgi:hypothetical protein